MKLNSELTAGTILRRRPRTHHDRFISLVLVHLSTPSSLDNPTTIAATTAVGRISELLMTEQTHSAYARPRRVSRSLHAKRRLQLRDPSRLDCGRQMRPEARIDPTWRELSTVACQTRADDGAGANDLGRAG